MEEQLQYPLAVTHLLQHTLRSLCIHDNSQWVYAVFWRILPRNYPPPKWDLPGSFYDRSRGNRRNWILVWEDGFCNFAASCEAQDIRGLQPELFFKMSHEIYNYGEGLIGKVASDHSHKWVSKEPQDQEINFLSSWHNPADSHPRTWEAQFQSGIKTIALIAVREGVVQLGAINKVAEDLTYVVLLRKKLSYLESIPGVLLPHPSLSAFPFKLDVGCNNVPGGAMDNWAYHTTQTQPVEVYNHFSQQMRITPSMSSLEALLSKLPSVGPATPSASSSGLIYESSRRPSPEMMGVDKLLVAKEEMEEEAHEYDHHQHQHDQRGMGLGGESNNSIIPQVYNYVKPNEGF